MTGIVLVIFVGWGIALFLAPPFRDLPSASWGLWANGFNLLMILVIRPLIDHLLVVSASKQVLRHRAPVAAAMSAAERRRFALERLELSVLVGVATAASLLLLFFALERPSVGPAGVAFIVASLAGLAWAIVQGARKWMLARSDHAASNLI